MDPMDLKPGHYWFKIGSKGDQPEIDYADDPWVCGIWDGQNWWADVICQDGPINSNLIQMPQFIPTPDGKHFDEG